MGRQKSERDLQIMIIFGGFCVRQKVRVSLLERALETEILMFPDQESENLRNKSMAEAKTILKSLGLEGVSQIVYVASEAKRGTGEGAVPHVEIKYDDDYIFGPELRKIREYFKSLGLAVIESEVDRFF